MVITFEPVGIFSFGFRRYTQEIYFLFFAGDSLKQIKQK